MKINNEFIHRICGNYFNLKSPEAKNSLCKVLLVALKCLSYLTAIIPVVMGLRYALSGRVNQVDKAVGTNVGTSQTIAKTRLPQDNRVANKKNLNALLKQQAEINAALYKMLRSGGETIHDYSLSQNIIAFAQDASTAELTLQAKINSAIYKMLRSGGETIHDHTLNQNIMSFAEHTSTPAMQLQAKINSAIYKMLRSGGETIHDHDLNQNIMSFAKLC